jgi:cell division septal protein FtsQ
VSERRTRSRGTGSRARPRLRFGLGPARAAAILGLIAGLLGLSGLTTTPAFAIRHIDVTALTWTDRAEVIRWLGVEEGANAFQVEAAPLAGRLLELPSIATAEVRVSLPDTVVVNVVEREPILAWRVGDATFLVDRDGVLFALTTADAVAAAALPSILDTRLASRSVLGVGTRLDPVDLDAATRLASLKPADVGSGTSALRVSVTDDDGYVVSTTPRSWAAVFGFYSAVLRTTDLIPGQVRLLRSLLFGREDRIARVILADDRNGTYVPLATPR